MYKTLDTIMYLEKSSPEVPQILSQNQYMILFSSISETLFRKTA